MNVDILKIVEFPKFYHIYFLIYVHKKFIYAHISHKIYNRCGINIERCFAYIK